MSATLSVGLTWDVGRGLIQARQRGRRIGTTPRVEKVIRDPRPRLSMGNSNPRQSTCPKKVVAATWENGASHIGQEVVIVLAVLG